MSREPPNQDTSRKTKSCRDRNRVTTQRGKQVEKHSRKKKTSRRQTGKQRMLVGRGRRSKARLDQATNFDIRCTVLSDACVDAAVLLILFNYIIYCCSLQKMKTSGWEPFWAFYCYFILDDGLILTTRNKNATRKASEDAWWYSSPTVGILHSALLGPSL